MVVVNQITRQTCQIFIPVQRVILEKHVNKKKHTGDPQYIRWTVPNLFYQTRRKVPLLHKTLRLIGHKPRRQVKILENSQDEIQC